MTQTTGSYGKEQQIHSLSLLSNAAFGLTFPNTSAITGFVSKVITDTLADSKIQACIGTDWTVVWGPYVFSHNTSGTSVVADNTMVLFYSPSQNLFVVAIAGTNIDSIYGWLDEDFMVNNLQTWQSVVGSGVTIPSTYATASISQGTYNGLTALLELGETEGETMLSALTAYISQNSITQAEVAVAGHSLGGALSPVMALYMQNIQQDTTLNWNSAGGVTTISAWPTAGPTPGEAVFAQYYQSLISSTFVYTSRYNTLDVIPHAWMLTSMEQVPTIYDSYFTTYNTPLPDAVSGPLVVAAMMRTIDSQTTNAIQYTQVTPWNSLTGTFNELLNIGAKAMVNSLINTAIPSGSSLAQYDGSVTAFTCFIAQMGYQHTSAYNASNMLNIQAFATEYGVVKQNDTPGNPSEEDLHAAALKRAVLRKLRLKTSPVSLQHIGMQTA